MVQKSRIRRGLRGRRGAPVPGVDVVLGPPKASPAFPHDHSRQRNRQIDIDGTSISYIDQVAWIAAAILTGLPATAAPIGKTETGLPIGIQIIGGYLQDRTTIAFAGLIEREFGGFTPPPLFA